MIDNVGKSMPEQTVISVLLVLLLVITMFSLPSTDWGRGWSKGLPANKTVSRGIYKASGLLSPFNISAYSTEGKYLLPFNNTLSEQQLTLAIKELNVGFPIGLHEIIARAERYTSTVNPPHHLIKQGHCMSEF